MALLALSLAGPGAAWRSAPLLAWFQTIINETLKGERKEDLPEATALPRLHAPKEKRRHGNIQVQEWSCLPSLAGAKPAPRPVCHVVSGAAIKGLQLSDAYSTPYATLYMCINVYI